MRSGSLAPRHPLSPPARPIPPNIRTTDVGPVPDPGHLVPPLARAHPCRLQGHRVPAGTPAGMSASRPASARPVAFRPGTRQRPDVSPDFPPLPHTIRQIIQAGRSPYVRRHSRAPRARPSLTIHNKAPTAPLLTATCHIPGRAPDSRASPWPKTGSSSYASPGPAHAAVGTRLSYVGAKPHIL